MAIAFDLDGTLAHYDVWRGDSHIGAPIPAMIELVKRYLSEGKTVYIFTARVGSMESERLNNRNRLLIEEWCLKHIGQVLPITATKLPTFGKIYDDRAIRVEKNTGRILNDDPIR